MRFRRIWGVGFWFASTLLAGGVAAQELMAPRLHAGVLGQTHAVDGRLEEPEWSTAPAVEDFAQTDPREGAAASGKTVVRVLAGAKALVIGIDCEQPPGIGVVSFSVRRDATQSTEDHVRVVIGPFLDGRSGYVFAVNPSGARYDGLINPGGESDNGQWDGIWEAATSRRAGGWSVEIKIPVHTLGFKTGLSRGWIPKSRDLPSRAKAAIADLIRRAGGPAVAAAVLYGKSQHARANAKTDPYALRAWCWKVLADANEERPRAPYKPGTVTLEFLRELARLSWSAEGPRLAREYLAKHGIALVTVAHLPRTYLDGQPSSSRMERQ